MLAMSGVQPESSEHEPIFPNAEQDVGDDGEDIIHDSESNVHIASHAEKKSYWWRNAIINTLFILAWYGVPNPVFDWNC